MNYDIEKWLLFALFGAMAIFGWIGIIYLGWLERKPKPGLYPNMPLKIDQEWLAEVIREANRGQDIGASELAECIIDKIEARGA